MTKKTTSVTDRFVMRKIIPGTLLLAVCMPGWADVTIRPGLWEITTKSDLLALVQHVPSAQMQQITNLARRYGLEIPHVQDGAAISKVCITPEMAEQAIPSHFYEDQIGCKVKNASKTGNRYRVELECDTPQFRGSGHAEGIFTNPENFIGKTGFNSTVQGTPVYMHADTTGRWIDRRCEVTQPLQ